MFDLATHADGARGHHGLAPPVLVPWGHAEQVLVVGFEVVNVEGRDGRHSQLKDEAT